MLYHYYQTFLYLLQSNIFQSRNQVNTSWTPYLHLYLSINLFLYSFFLFPLFRKQFSEPVMSRTCLAHGSLAWRGRATWKQGKVGEKSWKRRTMRREQLGDAGDAFLFAVGSHTCTRVPGGIPWLLFFLYVVVSPTDALLNCFVQHAEDGVVWRVVFLYNTIFNYSLRKNMIHLAGKT